MGKPVKIADAFLKHVHAEAEKSVRQLVEVAYQHGIQDERERFEAVFKRVQGWVNLDSFPKEHPLNDFRRLMQPNQDNPKHWTHNCPKGGGAFTGFIAIGARCMLCDQSQEESSQREPAK